jgi:enoyl-CoA hydratase/carnithine racemase
VTLNDPEKRNMLSAQMLLELVDALKSARDSEEVRAVVLTGAGEKAFCAGADLGGFGAELPPIQKHFASDPFIELFWLMAELGKPTLCAVNGHVLAGGLGVALSCDLLIAKEGATFGTPEINVGAFPFMIMAIIYRNVPRKKVNEMLLLGERMSAEEAVANGLANKAVPAEEFDAAVADWAGKLASKSPVVMRLGRDAMYRQQDMNFGDALEYLRSQLSMALSTEDIVEGVSAFFEKREPNWKGR